MVVFMGCSQCSQEVEDDLHVFLYCDFAQCAWVQLDFSPIRLMRRATSWLHLFRLVLEEECNDYEVLEKIIVCL